MDRRTTTKLLLLLSTGINALPKTVFSEDDSQPLCFQYLSRVQKMFEKIRGTELDNMLEASYKIAETYKRGGTCFCQWETGHAADGDMFPGRPGDTDIFVMGYTMGTPPVKPKSGDLLLVNVLRKPLDDPRENGLFVIGGPTPWCADTDNTELLTEANQKLKIKKYSDIWVETYITTHGAIMWLPGETAPLGPTSGALGIITFWAMIADAVRLLARDNVKVKLKGDEPKLAENTPFLGLNEPLAERYFDECIGQTGQVQAEYGTIQQIAAEVVTRLLSGGKLYVYSQYRVALSHEANGKRGGLALIKTTWAEDKNFSGTGKDFMIMGIYKPDDEINLEMLKKYRKTGMKIAAIGPAVRNGIVPGGDTVPWLADYHLGLMCDTYGLFAIPGVEQKVCPTSGLLVNLMFWSTIIEVAEEIMRRSGNTPAVLSTGAMKGGGIQRRKRAELAKMRGY